MILLPTPTLQSQFLTRQKFAWVLDVTDKTISNWEDAGKLTRAKFSEQLIRYDPQVVTQFILQHTLAAAVRTAPNPFAAPPALKPEQFEQLCQRLERLTEVLVESRLGREAA